MYEQFARFYDKLGWGEYAKSLWPLIVEYMNSINFKPENMLDVACGTGVLAIMASRDGIKAEGLDISSEMLEQAKKNAIEAGVNVVYHQCDMCDFDLNKKYDLITCTFDAINHLRTFEQWVSMFKCVKKHLNSSGLFIFDMNTLKDLRENWNNIKVKKHPRGDYLISKSISFGDMACVTFTAFIKKENGLFEGYEESIMEVSFPLEKVVASLKDIGFTNVTITNRHFKLVETESLDRAFISCRA
ncbi:Methyltransferase domain-containing protein [Caldanaerobius fijiensis DSM 17918]|uniref:Methyltransferase domain-containing protein n=1 Tax=Caldanaerobius fijiensis DSM 17918 TaxID=1121256 RepID=A0A1M5A8H5_9THEO|nr:class I SAM-dependent methyltransferase [Caldanaerobius fijiensis]SHF26600.1 Methyltransferase domain-containing protein [Caldanaerobius fijiensis DSM 17918]